MQDRADIDFLKSEHPDEYGHLNYENTHLLENSVAGTVQSGNYTEHYDKYGHMLYRTEKPVYLELDPPSPPRSEESSPSSTHSSTSSTKKEQTDTISRGGRNSFFQSSGESSYDKNYSYRPQDSSCYKCFRMSLLCCITFGICIGIIAIFTVILAVLNAKTENPNPSTFDPSPHSM